MELKYEGEGGVSAGSGQGRNVSCNIPQLQEVKIQSLEVYKSSIAAEWCYRWDKVY